MRAAAANLEFERAASLRDRVKKLRGPRAPATVRRRAVTPLFVSVGSRTRCSRFRSTSSSADAVFYAAGLARRSIIATSIEQLDHIGVESLTVVVLTGLFTGAVLALQTGLTLDQFGARSVVGRLVSASMVKELGPVLTALMVLGPRRVGHRRRARAR